MSRRFIMLFPETRGQKGVIKPKCLGVTCFSPLRQSGFWYFSVTGSKPTLIEMISQGVTKVNLVAYAATFLSVWPEGKGQ